jgi:2-methylcitrate dehydratase PrpD
MEGRFSVQYVTARALLDGEVGLADFRPDRVTEPSVVKLLARISVVGIEAGQDGVGAWGAQIVVHYDDGRDAIGVIDDISSRGSARSLAWHEVERKFLDCVERVLPEGATLRLLAGLRGIDDVPDVGELIGLAST